ncbi:MAG: hypothetical protein GY811_08520 [Myxococcales bacterium]|nr:hypothetical protein [Myxococcales bacterium]
MATDDPPDIGTPIRLDVIVGPGGPKVVFRGTVISRCLRGEATLPIGCSIAVGNNEREKINYLNGYVRGGLLNLREARRLPVHLKVTYGGMEGPVDSYTRDINDEGVFVVTQDPLPEESELHLFIMFPGSERACPDSRHPREGLSQGAARRSVLGLRTTFPLICAPSETETLVVT